MLETGAKLPDFSLPDQSGLEKKRKGLAGSKGLVLFAWHKDNTGGRSAEAGEFRRLPGQFDNPGSKIAGISEDTVTGHVKSADKPGLGYPLLSGAGTEFPAALCAFGEKKSGGKVVMGITGTAYVFDAKKIP